MSEGTKINDDAQKARIQQIGKRANRLRQIGYYARWDVEFVKEIVNGGVHCLESAQYLIDRCEAHAIELGMLAPPEPQAETEAAPADDGQRYGPYGNEPGADRSDDARRAA